MGQVILARDLVAAERPIAVKLLLPEFRDSTSEFMREYSVQRRLDHPSIPRVYDFGFGQHAGREVPYFAMDYVRGIPLANAFLQMRDPSQGYSWILQVLRGLDHLHRAGFLHRDLKPSNVLVTWDGDPEDSAHLIDFGIAIPFEETPEELFIGTPEYSAPELMAGSPFNVRQDLYAVGLLLYELVSGRRPWPGEDPTDLYNKRMYGTYPALDHRSCPPSLVKLVDDLLRPNPDMRPRSAAEVIERYNDALKQRHPVETALAFRRRLQTVLFTESETLDESAAQWLGDGPSPHPTVLLIEDPSGFDGAEIMHELTDRAAVGGSRVIRYALEPRLHGPLEALEPVLGSLRRLREEKGGAAPMLAGLAGAATLLTRLPGSIVIGIEGINWADTLSLELLATLFTGAKNPGIRVIGTVDPAQKPAAERAFERLAKLNVARYVARDPLSIDAVSDWVDVVVGTDVVPDDRVHSILERSEGRPQRVRELLTEDLRRGALLRTRDGFTWDAVKAAETAPDGPRQRTFSQPMLPVIVGSTLDDLVAMLVEPVPEGVVSTFLGVPSSVVRSMVADGKLSRDAEGWTMVGPRGPARDIHERLPIARRESLHERLAMAIELAAPFSGKAERLAKEWLRSTDPLKAVPYLLEAAQRAQLPRTGDVLPRASAMLVEAQAVLEREEAALSQAIAEQPGAGLPLDKRIDRIRGLRVDLGRARLSLARALGDWPTWQKVAHDLFERGLESAHKPTMELALDALMHLASDRGAEHEMVRHAQSLSDLSRDAGWANAWAKAQVEAGQGRLNAAIDLLRTAQKADYAPEKKLELLSLEAEILVSAGHLAEGEVAVKLMTELSSRLGDRARGVQAALLGARLLREGRAPDRALAEVRKLGSELGSDRLYRIDGRLELELAYAHLEFGWHTTAREHITQAVALSRRDSDRETLLMSRILDALLSAELGRHERAYYLFELATEDSSGLPRQALRELEFAQLAVGLVAGRGPDPQRVHEAAKRLGRAAMAEDQRSLAVRAHALSARAALSAGLGDEALECAQEALERSAEWGGVGHPRHQLLFLVARARHVRRDGFRARRMLGQARAQLQLAAKALPDPLQRAAFLAEPQNACIEAGELGVPGPIPGPR